MLRSPKPPWSRTLTCIGETAAAGGVFIGLGLRGVRGIAAAAGLGTTKTNKYRVYHSTVETFITGVP